MQLTCPRNVDSTTQANKCFKLLSDPSAGTHQVEQQHKTQNRDLLVHTLGLTCSWPSSTRHTDLETLPYLCI